MVAEFEPYSRIQRSSWPSTGEAEVQDAPSWIGVRVSTGKKIKYFAQIEFQMRLISDDTSLNPGSSTGGEFLTVQEPGDSPVFGNRLGFIGVDFGAPGVLQLGKQKSVHYDVASYTTDRLTVFGGGIATLAYPAGTDGGETGTGRADEALTYRFSLGIVELGGQLQFRNVDNGDLVDGYGASLRVNVLPGLQLGTSYTKAEIDETLASVVQGFEGEPEYLTVGARYSSDRLELGAVFATQQDGDAIGILLPDSGLPEAIPIAFDGRGLELYGRYKLGNFAIVGGFADYEPDTDDRPLLDPDFRLRYLVVGAEYHTTKNTYAYSELKFEDSIDAMGEPADDVFTAGFRYNFGRVFHYRP